MVEGSGGWPLVEQTGTVLPVHVVIEGGQVFGDVVDDGVLAAHAVDAVVPQELPDDVQLAGGEGFPGVEAGTEVLGEQAVEARQLGFSAAFGVLHDVLWGWVTRNIASTYLNDCRYYLVT